MTECGPYLRHRQRELLFREAVIGFLVGPSDGDRKKKAIDEYCRACRTAGKGDCKKCDRHIEVLDG